MALPTDVMVPETKFIVVFCYLGPASLHDLLNDLCISNRQFMTIYTMVITHPQKSLGFICPILDLDMSLVCLVGFVLSWVCSVLGLSMSWVCPFLGLSVIGFCLGFVCL